MDPPTSRLSAAEYATMACRRLEAAGVIEQGCCDPENLGALADAVFAAKTSQQPLVDILKPELVNATPNDGHKIAAGLLAEQMVGLILTLNFDRALEAAIQIMAHEAHLSIVHEVRELRERARFGVIYLHGYVESQAKDWILRTTQIDGDWEGRWQQYIVVDFALTPNVIFAGLGYPTPVIAETVLKVKEALHDGKTVFQVDKVEHAHNALAARLKVGSDDYVESCWTGFMHALGEIVAREYLETIARRHPNFCADNNIATKDISLVLRSLPTDFLEQGKLRARWFLDVTEYKTFRNTNIDHLVDIVQAIASALTIVSADQCVLIEDGMDFRKGGRSVLRVFSCSGAGAAYWTNVEAKIQTKYVRFRRYDPTTPVAYLLTGGVEIPDTSLPRNIVSEPPVDDVTSSPRDFGYFSPRILEHDPKSLTDLMRN
jgi:hypothetical protein